jgi:hypothetical protein
MCYNLYSTFESGGSISSRTKVLKVNPLETFAMFFFSWELLLVDLLIFLYYILQVYVLFHLHLQIYWDI